MLSGCLKTLRESLTNPIGLVSHTELATVASPLFDICPDPGHADSFLLALSSSEKTAILRVSNGETAQLARHSLKNQGPVSELSFNAEGELLLISAEEVSSHFRKVALDSLAWENCPSEELGEAIAGFWSESGLAISSFIPKGFDNPRESGPFPGGQAALGWTAKGSLRAIGKTREESGRRSINLEIPLQNVNFWRNNSRGVNCVFADNKLIVFKVKD